MSNSITVQQILDRIKTHFVGGSLHAGSGASGAVGIAITYALSLEVLPTKVPPSLRAEAWFTETMSMR